MVIYTNICFIFKQNTRNRLCNFIAVGHELQADEIAALILYVICVYIYIYFVEFLLYIFRVFTHQFQKAQVSIHFHKLFEHQLPPFFWHTFSYIYTEIVGVICIICIYWHDENRKLELNSICFVLVWI